MSETERRNGLFQRLDVVLVTSEKKFKSDKKRDELRLKWGRLLVNAVNSYGKLLETEELELRVEKLEEQLKDGVLIPNEERKQKTTRFRR